jgi:hypothetical protein
MPAVEFATCLVLMDPISSAPAKGYVMVCAAFYGLVCRRIDSFVPALILWLGVAPPTSFRDSAYGGLRDLV